MVQTGEKPISVLARYPVIGGAKTMFTRISVNEEYVIIGLYKNNGSVSHVQLIILLNPNLAEPISQDMFTMIITGHG